MGENKVKYVIIGCGVAGITAAQNIRKLDTSGEITILTNEQYPFYSRIRLIDFLAGKMVPESLLLKNERWYQENRMEVRTNTAAAGVDQAAKTVETSGGKFGYDRLLLATGGVSLIPPLAGTDKQGVFALRSMREGIEITEYAKAHRHVLIMGGGLLGLEAGHNLLKAGNEVTVAEISPRLLPRQMDVRGARVLKAQLERMGLKFLLGAQSKEITGTGGADGVLLADGKRVECDMILISAGVRPNSALAQKLGLKIEKGVVVNDRMETEAKDIFAAGDLIQHRGIFYGIWSASEKQGETAGINMAGGSAVYEGTTMSNTLKVAGVNLFSAGDIDAEGKYESIIHETDDSYRKLVISENRVIGAILYGQTNGKRNVLNAITSKKDISAIRKELEDGGIL